MQFNPILTRVAFPVFAHRQNDDAALRRGYAELSSILSLISFPYLIGAAIVAPDLVPAVFSDRWLDAVPLVQILALLGIFKALGNPQGSIYLAKVRPDLMLRNALQLLVLVTVFIGIAVQVSVEAAAAAHVLAVAINFANNRLRIERLIGLKVREYLMALWRPAMLTGLMGAVVLLSAPFVRDATPNELTALAVEVLIGVVTYGALLATLEREEMTRLLRMIRGRANEQESNLRPAVPSGR